MPSEYHAEILGEHPTRGEAESRLTRAGGRVSGSVSKNRSYVVARADPGSKLAKAKKLDNPILDEAGLPALLGSYLLVALCRVLWVSKI